MQVDQRGVFGGAAARLVQALAVQAERGGGGGKQPGGSQQVIFFDAAGVSYQVGRVVAHRVLQFVKAVGVRGDVGRVSPAFPQHDVQQAVEQRHVGAGQDGQVKVGNLGGVGAPRVAKNDLERRVGRLGIFDAPEQYRVRVSRVAADNEDALGVFHVVVAVRRGVGAQRLLVARHRAAHAQARVAVDVVGANQALGQLVEDVIVLGQQLAGNIKTHGIGSMLADDLGKAFAGKVQRAVPRDALGRFVPVLAPHRVQQPRLPGHHAGGGQCQRGALGAKPTEVGRVVRIAPDTGNLVALRFDNHTAADAAIRAR